MRNKLWYIEQDVSSTIYRAQIEEASGAFAHTINGSTLHSLWHHRLCHAGKFACDNVEKVADDVPFLRSRNTFFSCKDCSARRMKNKIKGFNRNSIRATCQGGQFNINFGFFRRKSIVTTDKEKLITSKDVKISVGTYGYSYLQTKSHQWTPSLHSSIHTV